MPLNKTPAGDSSFQTFLIVLTKVTLTFIVVLKVMLFKGMSSAIEPYSTALCSKIRPFLACLMIAMEGLLSRNGFVNRQTGAGRLSEGSKRPFPSEPTGVLLLSFGG